MILAVFGVGDLRGDGMTAASRNTAAHFGRQSASVDTALGGEDRISQNGAKVEQAVVEGNYMGSYRPYGYDILKTKTARTLIPNPEEAPIVKLMFEWTVKENISARKIAERLDAMGVPTYTGNAEWSGATVKTILTNPTYMGKVKWNDRMQVKTMVNGDLVVSRPRSNHTDKYMEYDGKHKQQALVDEETFKAASSRFHSDRTKSNFKLQNPLAGFFRCKNCGHTMVHQAYKKKPTVAPRYLHRQSAKCKVKSAIASDVINAVAHALKLYIEEFQMNIDNLPDTNENAIVGQIEALQKELTKAQKKLSKAFDDYEEGIYTSLSAHRRRLYSACKKRGFCLQGTNDRKYRKRSWLSRACFCFGCC